MLRAPLALALVVSALPAWPGTPEGLSVDVPVTAAVAGAGLVLWGATELAHGSLTPSACRWCDPPALDRHTRAKLVWNDPAAAGLVSDALVLALPASLATADFFFAGRDMRRTTEDVLVAVEAVALAAVGTQAVKFAVARRRPDAWARGVRTSPDDDLSFFSGHVSVAFAAAGAFGTVAKMRGYEAWPLVFAAGFSGAAAVGYFRVAADKHWLSDVAAAAPFGAAVGIAVPLLLHRGRSANDSPRLTLTPPPFGAGGLAISGTF